MVKLYAVRIFVTQWDAACEFYSKKLLLDERFRDDEVGWAEYDIGGPCFGIERVADDDKEGQSMVGRFVGASLHVEDIDSEYQKMLSRGVEFSEPPQKQPWGGSLAHFTDPDGNVLTLLG